MTKKAFFFDIDGTLCHEDESGKVVIAESTVNSLRQLKEKGHKVFIATGRPEIFISDEVLKHHHDGLICANGSVVKIGDNKIYEKTIPNSFIKDFLNFCEENNYIYMLEGDKAYIKNFEDEVYKNFFGLGLFPVDDVTLEYDFENSVTYNISVFGDVDEEKVFKFFGDEFLFAKQNFAKFLDIYYKDSTKADGMDKIIDHLKLAEYETYAFGDGGNDKQMIKRADYGIAMGNGRDELKELADYVTTDVDKDGIYNALKHFNIID